MQTWHMGLIKHEWLLEERHIDRLDDNVKKLTPQTRWLYLNFVVECIIS